MEKIYLPFFIMHNTLSPPSSRHTTTPSMLETIRKNYTRSIGCVELEGKTSKISEKLFENIFHILVEKIIFYARLMNPMESPSFKNVKLVSYSNSDNVFIYIHSTRLSLSPTQSCCCSASWWEFAIVQSLLL